MVGAAVPPRVVGTHAERLCQRRQDRKHEVLHGDGRCGDPAFVAEVPEGGAEPERVPWRAPGRGPAIGYQAGHRLVELLAAQRGPELDYRLDVEEAGIAFGMAHASRHDDGLAGLRHDFFSVNGEASVADGDDEALFLARMDVLGDHAARYAAPAEPEGLPVAVLGGSRELDPLPGGRVVERPEAGHRRVSLRRS